MNNAYVCRKLYLNIFLQSKGFKPFAQRMDKFDAKKMVWIYNNNTDLQAAVTEYHNQR